MGPRLLLLETSQPVALVGLADGDRLGSVRRLEETRRHARELAPTVAALLAEAGWRPRDLQGVVVGIGPGSYTGLRVGVMSAKTLAFATGCALLAVPTFEVIARQAPPEISKLDVLADAQQDKIYLQGFEYGGNGLRKAASPLIVTPIGEWSPWSGPEYAVSGPGLAKLRRQRPQVIPTVAEELWLPGAEALWKIGLERYRRGERDDVLAVEPLYLRPSSAEEQWKRLHSGAENNPTTNHPG